jgi:galactonate dehydratase
VRAAPVRLPREAAQGTAGSPHALRGGAGTYQWSEHYPALYSKDFETCLVEVTLEDGRVGWGEAQAPLAPEVPAEIVQRLLAPALVGESFEDAPERISELWWRMYATMRVRGQTGGFMLDAMAGVDLALWTFVPETPLRESVPAYISGVPGATVEARVEFASAWFHQGFRLFKLYYESDWELLLRTHDAIRQALPEAKVAVDALWHLPPGRALRCAAELAERGVEWLECPLWPEDVDGHARLVEETGVRLAVGESYRTRFEAMPFFARDIVTYWQPDLGRSGMTETLELARLARERGIAIVPHVSIAMPPQWNAAIRAGKMIANCPYVEYNPSVGAMANRFSQRPAEVREGRYFAGTGAMLWRDQ